MSFDAYHQGSPKTKKLAFKLYDDNAAMYTAFNENQFDILDRGAGSLNGSGVDESLYERLDFTAPGSFGMYLNLIKEDSPLNNQKVREAITYAIDRTALLEKLENPEFIVTSQMVPRSLAGYDGELSERQPDNEKVKNLLAEAGYPDGVELSFLYFEGVQDEPPILIEQLELAGFTIEAVPAKTGEEMFTGVESKEYDIFTSSFISDINDARDVFGSVSTKENPIFAMVDDPVFNELLTASDNEFDPIARTKALQKANQYIYNNVLWIPLRNSQYTTYYPKNVVVEALSTTDTNSIKFWKSGRISN